MTIDMPSSSNADTRLWWWALRSSIIKLVFAALSNAGCTLFQTLFDRNKVYPTFHFDPYQRDQGLAYIPWFLSDSYCLSKRTLPKSLPSWRGRYQYTFDSTTIKLCLQLCPWVRLHHDKAVLWCIRCWISVVPYQHSSIRQRLPFMTLRQWVWFL